MFKDSRTSTEPKAWTYKDQDWDLLSAIWIVACNDPHPVMSYKSIKERMFLPAEYDVRRLVLSRRDLFRPGGRRLLAKWKSHMLAGERQPNWIASIEDQSERQKAIGDLGLGDVFVSQFRTDEESKPSLDVIDWGLKHIERLRSAAGARRAERKAWVTQGTTILSLLIALSAVLVSWWNAKEQFPLKEYELVFQTKQKAYRDLMAALDDATENAASDDRRGTLHNMAKAITSFGELRPFLDSSTAQSLHPQSVKMEAILAADIELPDPPRDQDRKKFDEFDKDLRVMRDAFQNKLSQILIER
jgi:hypothetical protein